MPRSGAHRSRWVTVLLAVLMLPLAALASLPAAASAAASAAPAYRVMVSTHPDRSQAIPLAGSTLTGPVAVFLAPAGGVRSVQFDSDLSTLRAEFDAPFDYVGTRVDRTASLLDTRLHGDGTHLLSAVVTARDGRSTVLGATFVVANVFHGPIEADSRPGSVTLHWPAVPGAARYVVAGVTTSATVTGTSATLPVGTTTNGESAPSDGVVLGAYTADGQRLGQALVFAGRAVQVHPERLGVTLTGADRSGPRPLDGATLTGEVHLSATLSPGVVAADVQFVIYYSNDGGFEDDPPYDLRGTAADGSPRPFDTRALPDGVYQVETVASRGTTLVSLAFAQVRVANGEVRRPPS